MCGHCIIVPAAGKCVCGCKPFPGKFVLMHYWMWTSLPELFGYCKLASFHTDRIMAHVICSKTRSMSDNFYSSLITDVSDKTDSLLIDNWQWGLLKTRDTCFLAGNKVAAYVRTFTYPINDCLSQTNFCWQCEVTHSQWLCLWTGRLAYTNQWQIQDFLYRVLICRAHTKYLAIMLKMPICAQFRDLLVDQPLKILLWHASVN